MIKLRWTTLVFLGLLPLSAWSAGGDIGLLNAKTDVHDKPSLQRGAQLFVNYCMGCHSLDYLRYNRMGQDIGLTDAQVSANLMFASDKIGNPMSIAMRKDASEGWFGVAPPDLSVIARSRGANWLYSYLVTFYADSNPARPFGVNNVVFPDVGMPHVLWPLQGVAKYEAGEVPEGVTNVHLERLGASDDGVQVYKSGETEDGGHVTIVDRLVMDGSGALQAGQFRKSARDLVNFLAYAGEPAQIVRGSLGFWVLVFLGVFFLLTRALYKEYWRDVH